MNKISRIFAAILSIVMVFAIAGCQQQQQVVEEWEEEIVQGEDTQKTESTGTSSNGSATASTNNTGNSTGNKANDLGGKTITISYWGENQSILNPATSAGHYSSHQQLIADIEKKYNCKIKFKSIADPTKYNAEWTTAAMAGTKFADIAQLATQNIYPNHMKSGFLTALDSYIDINDPAWNSKLMKQIQIDGKTYAAIRSMDANEIVGIWYNEDVLNELGIKKTPADYVKENNWNWDTFLSIAKDATTTKGGVKYYGFGTDLKFIASNFATSNGAARVVQKNGKYTFNMGSSQYIKGIQFAYDLYNTLGYMPKFNQALNEWNSGRVAMFADNSYAGNEYTGINKTKLKFTYFPKGSDASDFNLGLSSVPCYGIPEGVENVEIIAKLMYEYLYPYNWRPDMEKFLENYFFDSTSLATAIEMTTNAMKDATLTPRYEYISKTIGNSDYGLESKTQPQSFIDSHANKAQAELDEVWGQ